MTRINCVPPEELVTKHLVAEYRELPRIFKLAHQAYLRGESVNDRRNPTKYTLGTGHVRFFYGRLGFLRDRFSALVAEMLRRGYNPQFLSTPECPCPVSWWGDWTPTESDMSLNRKRISDRLTGA